MEFVMKMFVNTSGVPLEPEKPRLDGRIVGGITTTIDRHPWMVWPLNCCSVWRYFEVLEQNRQPVFVMTHLKWQNILKKQKNNVLAQSSSGCIRNDLKKIIVLSFICWFINSIAVSFQISLLLWIVYQQTNE